MEQCTHRAKKGSVVTIRIERGKTKKDEAHFQTYKCSKCGKKVERTIYPYALMNYFSIPKTKKEK